MGVVGQEPILFGMSIIDNIRFGRDGVTDAEVVEATKMANAYDFIMKLPDVRKRLSEYNLGLTSRRAIIRQQGNHR